VPEVRALHYHLAKELAEPSAVYHVLDTTCWIPRVGYHVLDTTCWIPRVGYHSHPGHREGEGFSQRVVLWAGDLPEEHFEDRVGLRFQGCGLAVSPQGVITAFGLAEATSDERPIGDFGLSAKIDTPPTWRTKGSPL